MESIPEGETIYETWKENSNVKIIHILDWIGMPGSCQFWGDLTGTNILDPNDEYPEIPNIPPIIDDGGMFNGPLRDLFPENPEVANQFYPATIFMDHNRRIIHIEHRSTNLNDANVYINCMLDAM